MCLAILLDTLNLAVPKLIFHIKTGLNSNSFLDCLKRPYSKLQIKIKSKYHISGKI